MHLQKLPFLVQEEVFKQMDYGELFLVSQTSQNMARLLQRIKRGKIKKISYDWNGEFLEIFVTNKIGLGGDAIKIFPITSLTKKHRSVKMELIGTGDVCRLVCNYEPGIIYNYFTIYDKNCESVNCDSPRWPNLAINFDELNNHSAVHTIINHVDSLFGNKTEHVFTTFLPDHHPTYYYGHHRPEQTKMLIPKLLKIKQFVFFGSLSRRTEARWLNDVFRRLVTTPEKVGLYFRGGYGTLDARSKMFDVNELNVVGGSVWMRDIFQNFRGQKLHLQVSSFYEHQITGLIKRWKIGEVFGNLREVYVKGRVTSSPDRVQLDVGFRKIPDSMEKPVFEREDKTPVTIPTYIVRNDGIVAYVLFETNLFYFIVQDFTEEQMLANN